MANANKIFERYLEPRLSPSRFNHCLAVGLLMEKAGRIYRLRCDPSLAMTAGLLHDVAREATMPHMLSWLEGFDQWSLEALEHYRHPMYLHGPAGACIAKHVLGVDEGNILNAIKRHAGHWPDDSRLTRCLHVADLVAPAEDYPGREKLEALFLSGDLDSAELLVDTWLIEYFGAKSIPIHPGYHNKVVELNRRLNPERDFFLRT